MDLVVPGFKSYLQHGTDGEGRRRKEPRYQHNPTITFVSEYHYVFEFEIDTLLNLERVAILPVVTAGDGLLTQVQKSFFELKWSP